MQQGKDGRWFREKLSHFRCGAFDNSDFGRFLGGGALDDSKTAVESLKRRMPGSRKNNRPQQVAPFSDKKSIAINVSGEGTVEENGKVKRESKLFQQVTGPHEAVVLSDEDGANRQLATAGIEAKALNGPRLPFADDCHQTSTVDGSLLDTAGTLAPWGELPKKNEEEINNTM